MNALGTSFLFVLSIFNVVLYLFFYNLYIKRPYTETVLSNTEFVGSRDCCKLDRSYFWRDPETCKEPKTLLVCCWKTNSRMRDLIPKTQFHFQSAF